MSSFRISHRALRDVEGIAAHIAESSRDAAADWADGLLEQFRSLAAFPRSGRARPELLRGLRSSVYGDYIICYRPAKFGIEVARVLHGGRDLRAALKSR